MKKLTESEFNSFQNINKEYDEIALLFLNTNYEIHRLNKLVRELEGGVAEAFDELQDVLVRKNKLIQSIKKKYQIENIDEETGELK